MRVHALVCILKKKNNKNKDFCGGGLPVPLQEKHYMEINKSLFKFLTFSNPTCLTMKNVLLPGGLKLYLHFN